MSRIRHAYLILTGKLPALEDEMIDNTIALAAQVDAAVKALIAALQDAQSKVASASSDNAQADAAGVAALQPILTEAQNALQPPAQP